MITMRIMWMLKTTIVMVVKRIKGVMVVVGLLLLLMIMKIMKFCTHAQVCANDQVIRATPPHTAPVRGPCHPHGAATSMGLGGNLRLWRRGRRWWWWWNWNTHTYRQCKGVWRAAAPELIALYWTSECVKDPRRQCPSLTQTPFHSYTYRPSKGTCTKILKRDKCVHTPGALYPRKREILLWQCSCSSYVSSW